MLGGPRIDGDAAHFDQAGREKLEDNAQLILLLASHLLFEQHAQFMSSIFNLAQRAISPQAL